MIFHVRLFVGGYFPTPYTHQPDLVMTDRRQSRDQYLNTPKYTLMNTDVDRTDEIRKFHQVNEIHSLFQFFSFSFV